MKSDFSFVNLLRYFACVTIFLVIIACIIIGIFDIHSEAITFNGNPTSGWESAVILLLAGILVAFFHGSLIALYLLFGRYLYNKIIKFKNTNQEIQEG